MDLPLNPGRVFTLPLARLHAPIDAQIREGHPEDPNVALALEELRYFTSEHHIVGVYPADRERG